MSTDGEGSESHLVNEALVAYVGRGRVKRPERREDLVRALGGRQGEALFALVEKANAIADEIEVEKSQAVGFSLLPGFSRKIRSVLPWLDDAACDALCWASRYRRLFT